MSNTHGRIILAGGGGAADSRPLDELLVSLLEPHGKILYWPMAMRGNLPLEMCLEWFEDTFAVIDPGLIERIEMWEDLTTHRPEELDAFGAVYIGGGNTYALLSELRANGFDRALASFVRRGGHLYGGSAGAAVLGADIQTVSHMDTNTIGLINTRGLNLIEGHAVWVHYVPPEDEDIAAYVQRLEQPVLAIGERAGVVWDGARLRGIGFDPVYEFTLNGKRPL